MNIESNQQYTIDFPSEEKKSKKSTKSMLKYNTFIQYIRNEWQLLLYRFIYQSVDTLNLFLLPCGLATFSTINHIPRTTNRPAFRNVKKYINCICFLNEFFFPMNKRIQSYLLFDNDECTWFLRRLLPIAQSNE